MNLLSIGRRVRLVLPLLTCASLFACSTPAAPAGSTDSGGAAGAAPTATPSPTAGPVTIAVTPADKASEVRLDTPIKVAATSGKLTSVTVTPAGGGAPVQGTMDAAAGTWTYTGGLSSATSYVVTAAARGDNGNQASTQATFSTLTAKRLTTAATPGDGDVVGVGMPIKLRFNAAVPEARQAEFVKHLTVSTVPVIPGAWHWFSPTEVHYRPQEPWWSGTKVTLTASLNGMEAADNYWGMGNWNETFTIGDKHVSVIDDATHTMTVYNNDQPVYTWPVSLGDPRRWPTIGGQLVIWYKQYDVLMDSLSIGIPRNSPNGYYEHVYWDTAVSTNGFFVHAAPWSVGSQGRTDVSHGCVNLSIDRAKTFYNFSQVGDLVQILHTNRVADAGDGEGDWQIPFAQYANSGGQSADQTQGTNAGGI